MTTLQRAGDVKVPNKSATAPPRAAIVMSLWLRGFLLRLADRLMPAHLSLLEHAHGFAKAHILSAMAELGVADELCDGPRSAEQLAATLGCSSDALHRLLRAAAVFGAVRLDGDGSFRATRFTRVLRSADPSGAAQWCRFIGSAPQQAAWTCLAAAVRTGDSAFLKANGSTMFGWFDAHPDEAANFGTGIGGLTLAEAPAIIAAYDFPDDGTICDVGGGQGVLLAQILKARPRLRGVVVDSAQVLERASTYVRTQGLSDRIALVPGDLREPVAVRADLYLLKWILHDWDDSFCRQIVEAVAAAMPTDARLLLVEGNQPLNEVDPRFSMIDLQMFVVTDGGRERSIGQLKDIVAAGGLVPGKSFRTSTGLVLLEASKA
ncbi:MAG: hypothetical protein QOF82_2806 [Frankiales bacterium]|jgi:hypothetical protein|nr:hypothetical protein [Frankiales bacterium]